MNPDQFKTDRDESMKAVVKEAIKEFLREKWVEFSGNFTKWALGLFAAAVIGAVVYFVMWANGWKQP